MVKQIDTKKCVSCGVYSAIFLVKDGKCKVCLESVPKQEITENKPSEENNENNTNNV